MKHGGGFVMNWGYTSASGVGEFVNTEGSVNMVKYRQISVHQVMPFGKHLTGNKLFFDSVPKHTVIVVKACHISHD